MRKLNGQQDDRLLRPLLISNALGSLDGCPLTPPALEPNGTPLIFSQPEPDEGDEGTEDHYMGADCDAPRASDENEAAADEEVDFALPLSAPGEHFEDARAALEMHNGSRAMARHYISAGTDDDCEWMESLIDGPPASDNGSHEEQEEEEDHFEAGYAAAAADAAMNGSRKRCAEAMDDTTAEEDQENMDCQPRLVMRAYKRARHLACSGSAAATCIIGGLPETAPLADEESEENERLAVSPPSTSAYAVGNVLRGA